MIPYRGTQLWADVRWRDHWRIQSHTTLGISRLIDPGGAVRRRGSLIACELALDELAGDALEPEHRAVLLHGLGRTRESMRRMGATLASAGITVARLDYPSTRRSIEAHAAAVAALLDRGPAPRKLSFVTHSLGALVVRVLLARDAWWRGSVHRILMLAPPNQGAAAAASLDNAVLRRLMGPSFVQIARGVAKTLAVPEVPVSIVAGRIGRTEGDGLVKVEETKLPGMAEHHVVPAIHTFVMNHPQALECAASFLSSGDRSA